MAAGTRRWRTICAAVKREGRPCHLCTEPIDPTLRWPHPRSFSGDHLHPSHTGGPDTYANCGATHLTCNTARHDNPLTPTNHRSDDW